jgi:hypothetical protein
VAELEGDPDAGTDVAGGAATSTRPPYSLISADNVQKAMRGLGACFLTRSTHLLLLLACELGEAKLLRNFQFGD